MCLTSLILIMVSNSITLRKDKSILYSRIVIVCLISSFLLNYFTYYIIFLGTGIGLYGGLFFISSITNLFHMFIYILSSIILIFTGFFPRKIKVSGYNSLYIMISNRINFYDIRILNKNSEIYKILEYPLIILFIINGALFLTCASDLVSIFISIELQSYGLYLLSTIYKNSESATSGGLMYFLLGGLSSCFILLGTSLLYANSGTTNLDNIYVINNISSFVYVPLTDNFSAIDIYNSFSTYNNYYIVISLVIMTVGFLFKVSAAPFHFWSPDVYDAIPTIVTSFVAIVAKISIFILLLELVHYLSKSSINYVWTNNLLISSLLSLVIGSILGLSQSRIKRLYAYSTISHLGFILLGLSIHSLESIQAFMFYLIQYSFSNLNAFIILVTVGYSYYNYTLEPNNYHNTNVKYNSDQELYKLDEKESKLNEIDSKLSEIESNLKEIESKIYVGKDLKKYILEIKEDVKKYKLYENIPKSSTDEHSLSEKENSPIQLISQLKGYFYINPVLALSLTVTLFSFAGIPPLIGFFGKMMILSAAIDKGYIFMSLIAILTSVISAVYYLFIIKEAYFNTTEYSLKEENTDILTISNDKHVYKVNNIVLSNYLSISVSILTLLILLFIFIPSQLLNITSILVLILFNV